MTVSIRVTNSLARLQILEKFHQSGIRLISFVCCYTIKGIIKFGLVGGLPIPEKYVRKQTKLDQLPKMGSALFIFSFLSNQWPLNILKINDLVIDLENSKGFIVKL